MPPASRDPVVRYARTDWRRIGVVVITAAAMSIGLYLGITNRVEKTIERRGTPCLDENRDPEKVEPSEGCRRVAILLREVCRQDPKLCPRRLTNLDSPAGRRLIRRALVLERRRAAERRRESARTRARARRRRAAAGGRGGSGRGTGPSPQTPGGAPTPTTPGGGSPAPGGGGSGGGGGRPTPGDVVDEVLQDPIDALTDPSGTANDTLCSIGGPCDAVPPVPGP